MSIQDLVRYGEEENLSPLGHMARVADAFAQVNTLSDYREGKANSTMDRQRDDVACLETFLREGGVENPGMYDDLSLWGDMSAGLVKAFIRWMLQKKGLTIGTVNVRISTVRTYCKLAMSAGHLPTEAYQLIKAIPKISEKEGHHIDEKREVSRVGHKKAEATRISPSHMALLKQRLRMLANSGDVYAVSNLFLLCLLADHGLRCVEVSEATSAYIQLDTGMLRFYRKKTHKWQNIRLTADALDAAQRYFAIYKPTTWLFPGEDGGKPLARRTINWRVGQMGLLINIEHLSPHDLRHYFATYAQGDIGDVQQAGGWNNPYMLLKYRLDNEVANEGVVVPGEVGWRDKRSR